MLWYWEAKIILDIKGTCMEPGHATIANKNKDIKTVYGKVLG